MSEEPSETSRADRRRVAGVWLAVGSAPAAMVAASWYVVFRNGGLPRWGDMSNHAAIGEWMATLPWWEWSGWSDWILGGKAVGVTYPPLSHLWIRFTHAGHGQMAAVALGLLVVLPWGALRLSRAMGYGPSAQRAALAVALVLPTLAHKMYWEFSGFHVWAGFGSWPDMLAAVSGLWSAAWATRCRRPVACGVVIGLAVLMNLTVVPGTVVVCAVLLVTSGASLGQGLRWVATAGTACTVVCAWWLVPFVAGLDRFTTWSVPLADTYVRDTWSAIVVVVVVMGAAWAARCGLVGSCRLAGAAAAGLAVAVSGDLLGFGHATARWLTLPLLVAAVASAPLAVSGMDRDSPRWGRGAPRRLRPAWMLLGAASAVIVSLVMTKLWMLPLAVWMLLWPCRPRVWGSALAWTAVLLFGSLIPVLSYSGLNDEPDLLQQVTDAGGDEGMVYLDRTYDVVAGGTSALCGWDHYPWDVAKSSRGRIRPLYGMHGPYRESSPSFEFLNAEFYLRLGLFAPGKERPHWSEAWRDVGRPDLYNRAVAAAMGARWYAQCDENGVISVSDLPGVMAVGTVVAPYEDEESWHSAAVEWWISVAMDAATDSMPVPVLRSFSGSNTIYSPDRAATGVSMHSEQDTLVVTAEQSGWAWLRVPWDLYWQSEADIPVLKGGPGHLVVWVEPGVNILRWAVPRSVDLAAGSFTAFAVLMLAILVMLNRRRGFDVDTQRRTLAANALEVFADTVDSWCDAAARRMRRSEATEPQGATEPPRC